jgi:hypothetical protein
MTFLTSSGWLIHYAYLLVKPAFSYKANRLLTGFFIIVLGNELPGLVTQVGSGTCALFYAMLF